MNTIPTLALVGKTNVGKSTLFNRISEEQRALVSATPHTTRDRTRACFFWRGCEAAVSDSAGFDIEEDNPLREKTRKLIERSVTDAAVVGFVVNGREPLTEEDYLFAHRLRKAGKPVILIVNKIDTPKHRDRIDASIYKLGFKDITLTSAVTGSGVGDLLDIFLARAPKKRGKTGSEKSLRVILLGQTNVGKSTLLNTLLGTEEILTSPTPHTTRDPQRFTIKGGACEIELIDTAGLSRKRKGEIGNLSQRESRRMLREADIACLVVAADMAITVEDLRIMRLIERANVARLLVMNKRDLAKGTERRIAEEYARALPLFRDGMRLWVSAKTKRGMQKFIPTLEDLHRRWSMELPKEDIEAWNAKLGRSAAWQRLKFVDFSQVGSKPPRFRVRYRGKTPPPKAALGLLANQMKEQYPFHGIPIIIDAARA